MAAGGADMMMGWEMTDGSVPPEVHMHAAESHPLQPEPFGPRPNCGLAGNTLELGRSSCVNFSLAGNALELMMAPGDVLCVRGSGRLSEIGNVGGFLGHVLVVVAPPRSVQRASDEGVELQAAWPADEGVKELWRVFTIDCSRQSRGLHEAESLLYVERCSGRLIFAGEVGCDAEISLNEVEAVELWQSPRKLRESLRFDLMQDVVADMRELKGFDWSAETVARAVVKSSRAVAKPTHAETMQKIVEYWEKAPICTSVVVMFWQRYLLKLSGVVMSKKGAEHKVEPAELVMRWMPLKADRVLPGDLLTTLKSVGWVCMAQIPRIFQPMLCHGPLPGLVMPSMPSIARREESAESARFEDTTIFDTRMITLTC